MAGPTKSYPVILAAGDKGRARLVHGTNKALLDLAGVPVFTHVLAALERSPSVDRIYMVGPKAALEKAMARPGIPFEGRKPLTFLDQWENLYQNVWNTFQSVLREEGIPEAASQDMAVLVVPSDIPLLVPEEVEEFVNSCDMGRFDYVIGLTSESVLSHYYPQRHRKGIRLMYFHVREGSFRQNNLHLVKPLRMLNRLYVQKAYDYRLQREWGQILRLFWEIFWRERGTRRMVGHYVLLHLAALLHRIPFVPLYRVPAFFLRRARLERAISTLLGTRFATVETHYGGSALDIDTPEHYTVIQENFEAWREMQRHGLSAST